MSSAERSGRAGVPGGGNLSDGRAGLCGGVLAWLVQGAVTTCEDDGWTTVVFKACESVTEA
jgi:hypothetical protein